MGPVGEDHGNWYFLVGANYDNITVDRNKMGSLCTKSDDTITPNSRDDNHQSESVAPYHRAGDDVAVAVTYADRSPQKEPAPTKNIEVGESRVLAEDVSSVIASAEAAAAQKAAADAKAAAEAEEAAAQVKAAAEAEEAAAQVKAAAEAEAAAAQVKAAAEAEEAAADLGRGNEDDDNADNAADERSSLSGLMKCSKCETMLPKDKFSASQKKKKALAACKDCIAAAN